MSERTKPSDMQARQIALKLSIGINLWPGLRKPKPKQIKKLFK